MLWCKFGSYNSAKAAKAEMFASLIHSVHVSRPAFWFICVWLYLIVLGGHFQASLLSSPNFWIGLFYCTYPLNLLIYSWNDLGDTALDSKNPRKGWYLVGTKTKEERLQKFFLAALALNLIFCIAFVVCCGCGTCVRGLCWKMLLFSDKLSASCFETSPCPNGCTSLRIASALKDSGTLEYYQPEPWPAWIKPTQKVPTQSFFANFLDLAVQDIAIFLVMTCALNWVYNNGPKLRSGPPPLDLIGPCGYLLVLHLSCSLNGFAAAPIGTYAFHFFMIQRSQVSDIYGVDKQMAKTREFHWELSPYRRGWRLLFHSK